MDVKFRGILIKRSPEDPSILHGGWLKIKPSNPDYAQLLINKLTEYKGEELQVELSEGDSWTDRMNKLFHALVRKAVASGQCSYWNLLGRAPASFDEVKDWIKVQFGGAKVEIVGVWCHIESWTAFNKKRALQTLDNLLLWFMEQGIDIDAEKLEHESLGG
jgi:hypothetical protein